MSSTKMVKCIDNTGQENILVVGNYYEVQDLPMFPGHYQSVRGTWVARKDRFVDLSNPKDMVGKLVKCVDNSGDLGQSLLVIGKAYIVESVWRGGFGTPLDYYKLSGVYDPHTGLQLEWSKDRFVTADDECPITQRMPKIKNDDLDEEKCWKAMRPSVLPHECVCGIARVDCSFHRVS